MYRTSLALLVLGLVACQGSPRPKPDDPAITAAIDSIMKKAMEAAASADANGVLAMTDGDRFTFLTGDVVLHGTEAARVDFTNAYSAIQHQDQVVKEQKVEVISPDVAIFSGVGEGTYTTKAGVKSEPVGLGITVVFVREGGQWRARHAHQSFVF